jgi:hypothetical protein
MTLSGLNSISGFLQRTKSMDINDKYLLFVLKKGVKCCSVSLVHIEIRHIVHFGWKLRFKLYKKNRSTFTNINNRHMVLHHYCDISDYTNLTPFFKANNKYSSLIFIDFVLWRNPLILFSPLNVMNMNSMSLSNRINNLYSCLKTNVCNPRRAARVI